MRQKQYFSLSLDYFLRSSMEPIDFRLEERVAVTTGVVQRLLSYDGGKRWSGYLPHAPPVRALD